MGDENADVRASEPHPQLVEQHQAELVTFDTISRLLVGEENSNDTIRALEAHTGRRLKRRGIAVVRLDHFGKDDTKAARGGSAKGDDVDLVWLMRPGASPNSFRLTVDKQRQSWVPKTLTIIREHVNGVLTHTLRNELTPSWLIVSSGRTDRSNASSSSGAEANQRRSGPILRYCILFVHHGLPASSRCRAV